MDCDCQLLLFFALPIFAYLLNLPDLQAKELFHCCYIVTLPTRIISMDDLNYENMEHMSDEGRVFTMGTFSVFIFYRCGFRTAASSGNILMCLYTWIVCIYAQMTAMTRMFFTHPLSQTLSLALSPFNSCPGTSSRADDNLGHMGLLSGGSAFNLDDSFDNEGPMKHESESQASRKVIPFKPQGSSCDGVSSRGSEKDYPGMLLDTPMSSAPGSPVRESWSGKSISSPSRKSVVQIGTSWSVAIHCFKQSASVFECVGHMRHLAELLGEIEKRDRIRYCKADFINAVKSLQKTATAQRDFVFHDELLHEVASLIVTYFDENRICKLPTDMLFLIFGQLGIDEFSVYSSTCKRWNSLASRDEVWRGHYHHRFTRLNPTSCPLAKKAWKEQYRMRLLDPELGDKVEVAWRGKFRLEARDVYQGLAWWVAEVVDKHTSQGKYKIHYPGWESRWDEWVPRSRLRWAVDANTVCSIATGDVVELWCCGANVPGAWLESRVKKVRDGRFCVNRVLTTGTTTHSRPLWADRDRLRLVRHPHDPDNLKSCSSGSDEYERDASQPRRRNHIGRLFSYVGSYFGHGPASPNANAENAQDHANAAVVAMAITQAGEADAEEAAEAAMDEVDEGDF